MMTESESSAQAAWRAEILQANWVRAAINAEIAARTATVRRPVMSASTAILITVWVAMLCTALIVAGALIGYGY